MAHNYTGSNNINLFDPEGQFGNRVLKAAASARYIFTKLNFLTTKLFHPDDNPLYKYLKDDDQSPIEPQWYLPIIPMILVNGAEGIGTGYSTTIPCYNPLDIIANIRRLLADEQTVEMIPWYRGYQPACGSPRG